MRRLLVVVYWGAAALLIPWILVLLRVQRRDVLEYHSRLLWLCVGALMLLGMVLTGILCRTGSLYAVFTATFTATFLFIGAWFDILTSSGLLKKLLIGFALVVQLPISVVSFLVARHITLQRMARDGTRRLVPAVFIIGAVLLIPSTLRRVVRVAPIEIGLHQRLAWSGLDVFEVAGLLLTGLWIRKRSPWLAMAATATGTLLVSDAIFNVISTTGGKLLAALAMAAVAELPLAGVSFWLALREIGSWRPLELQSPEEAS